MKILFVHSYLATFTKVDLEILRSKHEVRELYVRKSQLKYLIHDIFASLREILWADLVLAWFGGYHALIPFLLGRLLGRKCVIIASGYDVANLPELNYGNMRPGIRRIIGKLTFRLADKVFAVSDFTRDEAIRNIGVPPTKVITIYHGIDVDKFTLYNLEQKEDLVITVGVVDKGRLAIKGFSNFVKVAAAMPNVKFVLVGGCSDGSIEELRQSAPHNIEFAGAVYGSKLIDQLQRAKVYVQGSAYESFGLSVAEAMLCGCIPVVTDRGALPEVTGGLGFIVPYGDISGTARAIQSALTQEPELGLQCRAYIQEQFPLDKRKKELLQAIEQVMVH